MKCLHFLFILLLVGSPLLAQKNFLKGYVVTTKGDTLRGWIDYRNWEVNPREISFKKDSLLDKNEKFTTGDLVLFTVTGFDLYRKAIVKKDMLPVQLSALKSEPDSLEETDTVFLRTIIEGPLLNLFELYDFKSHYYIQDSSNVYTELIYKRYMNEDAMQIVTRTTYRDQLMAYAFRQHAGNKLIQKIQTLDYNDNQLGRVVAELNGSSGKVTYVSDYNEHTAFSIFAGAGAAYSTLEIVGLDYGGTINFKDRVSPTVTAGVDFYSKRNLRDFVLRFQLSYVALNYQASKIQESSSPSLGTDTVYYSIKQNNITPAIAILYNLIRKKNFRWYLGAEFAYNFSTYVENRMTVNGPVTKSTKDHFLNFEQSWLMANIKTGVVISRKWEIGLTGKTVGSFLNLMGIALHPRLYSFWVGYHF